MSELSRLNGEAKDTELATTRGVRSVFSEVHAPGKNGFGFFAAFRGGKSEGSAPLNSPEFTLE